MTFAEQILAAPVDSMGAALADYDENTVLGPTLSPEIQAKADAAHAATMALVDALSRSEALPDSDTTH